MAIQAAVSVLRNKIGLGASAEVLLRKVDLSRHGVSSAD
jgi:hypothetical protein